MTPEDFHRVLKQQDREIRELKQDRHRQKETNAAFSKVITAQSAAQKRAEGAAVLYNYELTGLPRDDSEESRREFVMWCTEQAGIPAHEVRICNRVRRHEEDLLSTNCNHQVRKQRKSNEDVEYDGAVQSMEPPQVLQCKPDMGTVQDHTKVSRDSRLERKEGLPECSMADSQRARKEREVEKRGGDISQLCKIKHQRQGRPPPTGSIHLPRSHRG